jgi:predicted GNAT family N-acyltransferase
MAEFHLEQTRWQDNETALRLIRETVFMQEQQVPEELEWDGLDETAIHLLARDPNGNPIATARMLVDGHIGRVAVLSPWRGRGIGSAMMQRLLQIAAEHEWHEVHLDAQAAAVPFYQRLGFTAHGSLFMDAGIPHRHMQLTL